VKRKPRTAESSQDQEYLKQGKCIFCEDYFEEKKHSKKNAIKRPPGPQKNQKEKAEARGGGRS